MKQPIKSDCSICGKALPASELISASFVRQPIVDLILTVHPGWTSDSHICHNDLNRLRSEYVQNMLRQEKGELTALEQDVISSLREHDILSKNVNSAVDDKWTFGQRLADHVASFGGSWRFIIIFASVLVVWILINTLLIGDKPFDPFPFILLNLVLSCLAAIQAPIIMMSQNRVEAKDRLTAENDYRVNLKAELEIRHLHSKIDLLLTHQWQRLLEIQQVQTDLLEELGNR